MNRILGACWTKTLPEVRIGVFGICLFLLWVFSMVALGPTPSLFWPIVLLVVSSCTFLVALRLLLRGFRVQRAVVIVAGLACVGTTMYAPLYGFLVELHLISRLLAAGGPLAMREWAETVAREHALRGDDETWTSIPPENVPPRMLWLLPGRYYIAWGDDRQPDSVTVELGGGFYHYGVTVDFVDFDGLPRPGAWWQHLSGWPPEVRVYHE